jgi:hypothetical protein
MLLSVAGFKLINQSSVTIGPFAIHKKVDTGQRRLAIDYITSDGFMFGTVFCPPLTHGPSQETVWQHCLPCLINETLGALQSLASDL